MAYYISRAQKIKPRDGMPELIEKLHNAGVLQGVVTSGVPGQVAANLAVLGPAALRMAFVLNANDVAQSKPDPQGYQIAQSRFSQIVASRDVDGDLALIAVEDSPSGATAALAANLDCIQFLLPGTSPMMIPSDKRFRFSVARTSAEVAETLDYFFAASERAALLRQNPSLSRQQRGPAP